MSITERLAHFVVETGYDDIPPHIREIARNAVFDCLATTLAGSREECGRITADQVREYQAAPVSTVVGAGLRTAPPLAALANGTAGHAHDYDDSSVSIFGHASVAIVPAALALAEASGASGRDLLAAYTVAYEVGQRVGNAVNPRHYALGWHSTATVGSLRAVAAAARILRLDVPATRRAFGIAASMASGLTQNIGTMTKPLHAGLAARNGVLAAQLAARGYTSDPSILEVEKGFCHVFCGGDQYAVERIVENLGDPYCLERPGIVFKPYPCCRAAHPVIDGVLHLRGTHDVRADEVARVRCGVNYMRVRIMKYDRPTTVDESRFSMQFCAAVALMDGRAGLRQFSEARLNDPAVRALCERVEMFVHPTMRDNLRQSAEVEFTLRDGRVLNHWVETPLGSPGNLVPRDQMVEKFQECAEGTLSPEDTGRAIDLIEALPEQQTLADLMAVVGGRRDG